jgi:hypothetical protein
MQIGVHHIRAGWRRIRACAGQQHLHPQACSTEPPWASALRVWVDVGRLQTEPSRKRTVSADTAMPVLRPGQVAGSGVD